MRTFLPLICMLWLISLSAIEPFEIGYSIDEARDFANGDWVSIKRTAGKKEIISREPDTFEGGWSAILKKYELGHDKPVLSAFSFTSYDKAGKARMVGCGISCYETFFQIVREFNPPVNEVREMYDRCIQLYEAQPDKFHGETTTYLNERYDFYQLPRIREKVIDILRAPDFQKIADERNKQNLIQFLTYYQKDAIKENFTDEFLLFLNRETVANKIYLQEPQNLFLKFYRDKPDRKNTLYLAMYLCHTNEWTVAAVFAALDKAKKLQDFLKETMPEQLPGLPQPLPSCKRALLGTYYENSMENCPERQAALAFAFTGEQLYPHFLAEWAKLCPGSEEWRIVHREEVMLGSGEVISFVQYEYPSGRTSIDEKKTESPGWRKLRQRYRLVGNKCNVNTVMRITDFSGNRIMEKYYGNLQILEFYDFLAENNPSRKTANIILDELADLQKSNRWTEIPEKLRTYRGRDAQPEIILPAGSAEILRGLVEKYKMDPKLTGYTYIQEAQDTIRNVNESDKQGWNELLLCAVELNSSEIVQYLLQHGRELDMNNPDDLKCAEIAVRENYPEVLEQIRCCTTDDSFRAYASYLLRKAALGSPVKMLEYLLKYGADINVKDKVSAFHYAVASGSVEAVGFLIDHGADVNARDGRGQNPLFYAVQRSPWDTYSELSGKRKPDRLGVIRLLLEKGADPNAGTDTNYVALSELIQQVRNHPESGKHKKEALAALELFLKHGANPDIVDKYKNTPRSFARGTWAEKYLNERIPDPNPKVVEPETKFVEPVTTTLPAFIETQ